MLLTLSLKFRKQLVSMGAIAIVELAQRNHPTNSEIQKASKQFLAHFSDEWCRAADVQHAFMMGWTCKVDFILDIALWIRGRYSSSELFFEFCELSLSRTIFS